MKKVYTTIIGIAIALPSLAQWTIPGVNINNTNTGNVGIGTTNPARKLDVLSGTGVTPFAAVGPNGYILVDNVGTGQSYYRANVFHQFQGTSGTPILTIQGGGNVGIGTTSPQSIFNIQQSAGGELMFSDGYGGAGNYRNSIKNIHVGSNDAAANKMQFYVGDGTATGQNEALTLLGNGSVGIGTTAPEAAFKLSVNGTIRSKEIKVQATWSDYVFDKEYQLKPITEVDAYIKKNHHLPDVPSAAEVEKNGVNLGETSSLLLKKIEELTIYLIEKDKQLKELNDRVIALEKPQPKTK
jgi:hypothetical protein